MVRPPGRRVENLDETVNAFRGTRWIAVARCRPADPGAEGPVERWSRAGSSLRPGAGRTPRPGAARTDGVRARTGRARHRLAGTTALPMTRPGRRRRSPAPTRCGAGSAGGCWTRGITAGRSRRSGPAGGAGPARDRRRGGARSPAPSAGSGVGMRRRRPAPHLGLRVDQRDLDAAWEGVEGLPAQAALHRERAPALTGHRRGPVHRGRTGPERGEGGQRQLPRVDDLTHGVVPGRFAAFSLTFVPRS